MYNAGEGIAALVAGVLAESIALVGFGVDSVIEVISSFAALWRLGRDTEPLERVRADRIARQIIGGCFIALVAYIAGDAVSASSPARLL